MKKSIEEIYRAFLNEGIFFENFPSLTGVWSQDADKFPDLFVQYETKIMAKKLADDTGIPELGKAPSEGLFDQVLKTGRVAPVMRDGEGNFVAPQTAESILKTLKASNNKVRIIQIHLQKILLDLELYNLGCEKGFEISLDDLINYYKSRNKKDK